VIGNYPVVVSIVPDAKDWTWVLEAPCDECGLDTRAVGPGDVPVLVRRAASVIAGVLAEGDAARRRPAPGLWSPLEYACHVRDVARRFDARLRLLLSTVDEPRFENWDQDATAVQDGYAEQDPARVAAELTEAAERLAQGFEAVPPEALERAGYRADGVRFTVSTLGRYVVHEFVHHAHDVTIERAGSGETESPAVS
jgi:hypothetical protein